MKDKRRPDMLQKYCICRWRIAACPGFRLEALFKSQNHRMVGVERNLCGSSSPTLLPKQGHLQQAAQDLVQAGLEYLQKRRLHNLPWAACSSAPSPSEGRSSSSCWAGTSCASVCAHCPLSCRWAPWHPSGTACYQPLTALEIGCVASRPVTFQPCLP